jgi:hypothetical protein
MKFVRVSKYDYMMAMEEVYLFKDACDRKQSLN